MSMLLLFNHRQTLSAGANFRLTPSQAKGHICLPLAPAVPLKRNREDVFLCSHQEGCGGETLGTAVASRGQLSLRQDLPQQTCHLE